MSDKTISNEQWKHGGICHLCRRKSYCKNECSERKKNVVRRFRYGVIRKMGEYISLSGGVK